MYLSKKKIRCWGCYVKCVSSLDDILQSRVKPKGQLTLNRGSLFFLSTANALNPLTLEVLLIFL